MPTINIQIEIPSAPARTIEEFTRKIRAYAQSLSQRMSFAKPQHKDSVDVSDFYGIIPDSPDYSAEDWIADIKADRGLSTRNEDLF